MSSSSDGPRGARGRVPHPPPAAVRQGVDRGKQVPVIEPYEDITTQTPWQFEDEPASQDQRRRATSAARAYRGPEQDVDPRTGDPRAGPAALEFQRSPLHPRQARAVPQAPGSESGRLPQRPEDLHMDQAADSDGDGGGDYDLGAVKPKPARQSKADDGHAVLSAPTRAQRGKDRANAPIVPAGSVTGRSLTLVIAIMCFLACLTAGAVYLINQSARAWLRDIASEVTVQVEAREKIDIEGRLQDVVAYLKRQPGVADARALSLETSSGLLEPWLGQSEALKNLPVPRLIAVEIDRVNPPDMKALGDDLAQKYTFTTLDDHRHWQRQIRTVTRSFALGGFAILMLVGAATTAVIVSATRSALASNREIVEVLHFVGATDRFIARQFQRHFLRLGIRAGIFGALLAGLTFLGMPFAMELLGGGSASLAEVQHLIGTGALDLPGYGWLAAVVVVIAALCMITSRIGVYRILHSQH